MGYNWNMRPPKQPAVYILASKRNGTLYIGVTSDLPKRVWEHKNSESGGFAQEHNVRQLVYYELFSDMPSAIEREKQLKRWKRSWKKRIIEEMNPDWRDLYDDIV